LIGGIFTLNTIKGAVTSGAFAATDSSLYYLLLQEILVENDETFPITH
jgi:hypothetical protein